MNADHEEAVEFAKISKRENRVYVGNLSYDVKYRDLMEFMRGGGWGNLRSVFRKIVSSWGRKDVVAWLWLCRCWRVPLGDRVAVVLKSCSKFWAPSVFSFSGFLIDGWFESRGY